MAKRRYTVEQMEFMLKRYGSDAGIARYLGVSRQSVQKQRTLLGVPSRLSVIPERNETIIRLHTKGWTIEQIIKKFNLSITQINKIINEWRANNAVS